MLCRRPSIPCRAAGGCVHIIQSIRSHFSPALVGVSLHRQCHLFFEMTALGSVALQRIANTCRQQAPLSGDGRPAAQMQAAPGCSLSFGASLGRALPASRRHRKGSHGHACATASSEGSNPLAKLGRVLQEKAKADFERVFKVRAARSCRCALLVVLRRPFLLRARTEQYKLSVSCCCRARARPASAWLSLMSC